MQTPLRRGLPRVIGGEPWPPAGSFVILEDAPTSPSTVVASTATASTAATAAATTTTATTAAATTSTVVDGATELVTVPVRQGLPRTTGGDLFPPVSQTTLEVPVRPEEESVPVVAQLAPEPEGEAGSQKTSADRTSPERTSTQQAAAKPTVDERAATGGANKQGSRRTRWLLPLAGIAVILVLGVVLARFVLGTDWGANFIARFDGQQPLPANAPVGIPAWLNWAHFFNMFLLALIIKTGLSVRTEKKPEAYWAPKNNPRGKISLTLWLHLMLDIAWVSLGAIFYILLFTTGQWMRIVPTSIETLPNAVSAGLQYLSLEWPTENAWVHYNALQELTYFTVVFIAAPIAIISGVRMSPWWPRNWAFIPMKTARALHFPTMIFFLAFTVVHVGLVMLTGMRLNLNAMFASRGDTDPTAYATDWTGTLVFIGAVLVMTAAWFIARPAIVAPLARLTGKVSNR